MFNRDLNGMRGNIFKVMVVLLLALLAGCGDDAFTQGASNSGGGGGGGGGTGGTAAISLALTDASDASTTSISADSPGTVTATVLDANGDPAAGVVVSFEATLGTFNPTAGTALTNSSGVATVTLIAGTTTGADTLTATASVDGEDVSASKGYVVEAPNVSLSALTIGVSPLSANGTTSVSVTVQDGDGAPYSSPVDVSFSSTCSASDKATLGSPITTVNGVATSNYLDKGCANTDTITASLTVGGTTFTRTATLVVSPPSAGSIQFISASPTLITLKGTGGAGLQETSTVTFKVVDSAGNALSGTTVNFSLSTSVGGLALTTSSATSDSNGEVTVGVSSGSVATAVRVIARVAGSTLATQSDQLTVSTGVPAQDRFSLSAETHAIEGWSYDNETTDLTVILSDHFGNPAPNGTAVNFISEGAQIEGSCTTTNGQCSVTFTSAELRPSNGRVTVLAYGIGEEGFTDMDGDGYVNDDAERVDANGASTDMGEAWVDYDEDGTRDATEPFINFSVAGYQAAGDGEYNGVLCTANATCSATQSHINVRGSDVIVLSGSSAVIKAATNPAVLNNPDLFDTAPNFNGSAGPLVIGLDACATNAVFDNDPVTVYLQISDVNGNTMPAGTTISVETTNGTIEVEPASPVPDNIGCVHGDSDFPGCPADAPDLGLYAVVLTSDATQSDNSSPPPTYTCTNSKASGLLTVTVTSPKGLSTFRSYTVTD